MSDMTLSQDEVDALLGGSDAGDVEADSQFIDAQPRPYDMSNQERIVRGRMPALEIVNERFTSNLRNGIFSLTRRTPEITVSAIKVKKFSAFLSKLVVPTNFNIVSLNPLKGLGLVIFEPQLVSAIVDNLFGGGTSPTQVKGRDFSATEYRIIKRLLDTVIEQYKVAWAPTYPLVLEYQRSEIHTQFAAIVSPSESVITTSFTIDFGDSKGELHMCFPYGSFETIKEILFSPLQNDHTSSDSQWLSRLSHQIEQVQVELSVNLSTIQTTVSDLMNLQIGQILDCNIARTLTATVEEVPLLECHYGTHNGKYAIRIKKFLNNPEHLLRSL